MANNKHKKSVAKQKDRYVTNTSIAHGDIFPTTSKEPTQIMQEEATQIRGFNSDRTGHKRNKST
jgi:hypothetical protein